MIKIYKKYYWRILERISILTDKNKYQIRETNSNDHLQLNRTIEKNWGSAIIVSCGKSHISYKLPGFIAFRGNRILGYICYSIENEQCEIVLLESLQKRNGIGQSLIEYVRSTAEKQKCKRLWLVTTNDNTYSLRFYQKIGFHIVAVYRNAIVEKRKLRPDIHLVGYDGIPCRDEIELEMVW